MVSGTTGVSPEGSMKIEKPSVSLQVYEPQGWGGCSASRFSTNNSHSWSNAWSGNYRNRKWDYQYRGYCTKRGRNKS